MLFIRFWRYICTFMLSQTSTRNYVFISLIAFRKKRKKIELGELNALLFSPPSFKKLECVHLLATELLLWDPSEWAHLSWGPHTHFLFIVPHFARFLPPKTSVCWSVGLKLCRTFASAGHSLKVSFLFKPHTFIQSCQENSFLCNDCCRHTYARKRAIKKESFKISWLK